MSSWMTLSIDFARFHVTIHRRDAPNRVSCYPLSDGLDDLRRASSTRSSTSSAVLESTKVSITLECAIHDAAVDAEVLSDRGGWAAGFVQTNDSGTIRRRLHYFTINGPNLTKF